LTLTRGLHIPYSCGRSLDLVSVKRDLVSVKRDLIRYACGRSLGQFLHFSYALDIPPPYPSGGHEVGKAVAAGLFEGAAGQTQMWDGADVSSSPQEKKKKSFGEWSEGRGGGGGGGGGWGGGVV